MFSLATCTLLNNSFWRKQCFVLIIICELLEYDWPSSLMHNGDTLREEKNMRLSICKIYLKNKVNMELYLDQSHSFQGQIGFITVLF